MTRRKLPPVADEQEILALLTRVARGQATEETLRKSGGTEERIQSPPKISEMCRAAELIGKHYGTFDRKEEARPRTGVTDEVLALLAGMHEADEGGG